MGQLGFQPSRDVSLFFYSKHGVTIYFLVYVDVIIDDLLADLQTYFALKDLGDFHYFLGIEVTHQETGLILSQGIYVADLVARSGL